MCEWVSMIPGIATSPAASMTVTPVGSRQPGPDGLDLAVLDQDRALGDRPLGHGQDRRVLDQYVAAGVNRRLAVVVELGRHVDERRRGRLGGCGLRSSLIWASPISSSRVLASAWLWSRRPWTPDRLLAGFAASAGCWSSLPSAVRRLLGARLGGACGLLSSSPVVSAGSCFGSLTRRGPACFRSSTRRGDSSSVARPGSTAAARPPRPPAECQAVRARRPRVTFVRARSSGLISNFRPSIKTYRPWPSRRRTGRSWRSGARACRARGSPAGGRRRAIAAAFLVSAGQGVVGGRARR